MNLSGNNYLGDNLDRFSFFNSDITLMLLLCKKVSFRVFNKQPFYHTSSQFWQFWSMYFFEYPCYSLITILNYFPKGKLNIRRKNLYLNSFGRRKNERDSNENVLYILPQFHYSILKSQINFENIL